MMRIILVDQLLLSVTYFCRYSVNLYPSTSVLVYRFFLYLKIGSYYFVSKHKINILYQCGIVSRF